MMKPLTQASLNSLLRYIWEKPKRIPAEQEVTLEWKSRYESYLLTRGEQYTLELIMSTWRGIGREETSRTYRWWSVEIDVSPPRYIFGERELVSWLVETVGQATRYLEVMVIPPPRPKSFRLFPCSSVPRTPTRPRWSSRIGKKSSTTRALRRGGAEI